MRHFATIAIAAAIASLGSACGVEEPGPGSTEGIPELDSPLTALTTPCTFTSSTGIAVVAMAADEVALVARRAVDSAILVNGDACGTATATSMKRMTVTGSTGDETVIFDFQNGLFGAGTTSLAGLVVDLAGSTADAVKVRGLTSADTVTFGDTAMNFGADSTRDMTAANTESFVVSLGAGNDTFTAAGGAGTGSGVFASAVQVFGGSGNDTLTGGSAADDLNGGDGTDTISGGAGDDELNGDAGDDTFNEGTADSGSDTFSGGAGTDTVSYASRDNALTVDIETTGSGTDDDGEASEGDEVLSDVEAVVGGDGADTLTASSSGCTLTGGAGDDVLTGGAGDDTINGGAGDDSIAGAAGDDTLNGDAGDDVFDEGSADSGSDVFNGGTGTDTVDYADRTNALTVTMDGSSANDGESGEADDVNADVEDLLGGDGGDTITGNASANTLTGGAGDDTLTGGAGDDVFDEEAADSGSDTINGGTGTDTVDYSARVAALTITMDGATADDGLSGEGDDVEADVEACLGGTAGDTITGNALDNSINGGAGADTLSGGAGNDLLEGAAGDDTLSGGTGDDVLDGETGTDTLDGGAGEGDICMESGSNCEL